MISIIKSVSCRSCGNDITILDVGKDPALSLCAICKPWVTNSLDRSPREVIGIAIDDLELFKKYRSITKGIKLPSDDYTWNLFICAMLKSNGYNDLLEKVQQDYQARLEIHPELRDFLTISWSEISENDVPRKTFSDVDIVNDIISTFNSYEKEKQHLITIYDKCNQKYLEFISTPGCFDGRVGYSSGFEDYNKAKKNLEKKLYNIQSIILPSEIISNALGIEEYDCISREFIIQLLFDYVKSDQSYSLDDALDNVKKSVAILDRQMECSAYWPFKIYPNSPLVLEILSKIISGDYCKNSHYSVLSIIANHDGRYDQSHNFHFRDPNIWQKSFDLLRGIIRTLTFSNVIICDDKLKVRGKSGRWYVVAPVEIGGIYDQFVVTTLNEGAIDEGGHVCIHIGYRFQDMPLGDQLASLVMTLHNDKALFDEIDVHIDSYY